MDINKSTSSITTTKKNAANLRAKLSIDQNILEDIRDRFGDIGDTLPKTVKGLTEYSSSTGHPNRREVNTVCINDTWTTDYKVKTKTTGGSRGPATILGQVNEIFTIESIDKSLTVPAGTYTTYQLKIDNGSGISTFWYDISSGALVKSVNKSSSGKLIQSEILTKLKRPRSGIDLSGLIDLPEIGDLIDITLIDPIDPNIIDPNLIDPTDLEGLDPGRRISTP